MGIPRVRGIGHAGHPQRQAGAFGGSFDLGIGARGLVATAELCLKIAGAVHALARHVGVQLERVPFHAERVRGVPGQRVVKIGLADIAPGANGVGKDVETDHGAGFA